MSLLSLISSPDDIIWHFGLPLFKCSTTIYEKKNVNFSNVPQPLKKNIYLNDLASKFPEIRTEKKSYRYWKKLNMSHSFGETSQIIFGLKFRKLNERNCNDPEQTMGA